MSSLATGTGWSTCTRIGSENDHVIVLKVIILLAQAFDVSCEEISPISYKTNRESYPDCATSKDEPMPTRTGIRSNVGIHCPCKSNNVED
eukprot:TRINITY_DN45805_c0_g1_i1.p2 TRINITY_DN45805_c0_g1~~TRINITY_DN45805_c0_g1_i1.p2  ORF type:complete len:104 (-),score=12.41 TRINITY_DN45805_c0_g1_i1:238-507(-)